MCDAYVFGMSGHTREHHIENVLSIVEMHENKFVSHDLVCSMLLLLLVLMLFFGSYSQEVTKPLHRNARRIRIRIDDEIKTGK